MSIKPITPAEVTDLKQKAIPDEVFAAFNQLIAKHWDGQSASFSQPEVVDVIVAKISPANGPDEIFENRWLDVEDSYRAAGWTVEYDKPAYNETYAATFTFKKARRKR